MNCGSSSPAPGRCARPCSGRLLALAVWLFAAGCSTPAPLGGRQGGPPLPPSAAIMEVAARDYRFEHPPEVPAGRVVFRVQNRGTVEHELVLIRIPEELKGTLESQLRSPDRIAVTTLALAGRLRPGRSATFAIDGTPGRYGMICFLPDPEGTQHALKGMASEFLVTPLVSPPAPPSTPGRS